MLEKIQIILKFETKRKKNIITPCCNKTNKDNKFVTYKGFSDNYGYCHSCGTNSLPPTLYQDKQGNKFYWNEMSKKFDPSVLHHSNKNVIQNCNTSVAHKLKKTQYIDLSVVNKSLNTNTENNLLQYLRKNYNKKQVDTAKKMYYIGTNNNNGCVFWYINKNKKTQKAKIVYYLKNGKRSNYFKVPYKNENGFNYCLFGEHLLHNNSKPIVLVESEKTAIVSSIILPNFTWLSYGGINGLTNNKVKSLSGQSLIIIPDMSSNALSIIKKKTPIFNQHNISVKIWDMTEGKTDEQLKENNLYNCDLEDIFRTMRTSIN